MGLTQPKPKTTNLHLRVREDLRDKLQILADRDKRTLSSKVSLLLEELVESMNPKTFQPASKPKANGRKVTV
jgi:hypothetical protein